MKTVKFTEAKTENLKKAICLLDLYKNKATLGLIKEEASTSDCDLSKCRTFKQAYELIVAFYQESLEAEKAQEEEKKEATKVNSEPVKHKHYAINMILLRDQKSFSLLQKSVDGEWFESGKTLADNEDKEYFICRKELTADCLEWLNGSSYEYKSIWDDEAQDLPSEPMPVEQNHFLSSPSEIQFIKKERKKAIFSIFDKKAFRLLNKNFDSCVAAEIYAEKLFGSNSAFSILIS